MQPQRLVGIMFFIVGIVLLIWGLSAMDSFSSQVSDFFTGSPTDRAIWLTIGGIVAMGVGAAATLRPLRTAGR